MKRDSFVFYRSFYESIRLLPDEIKNEVLPVIIEYGLNGEEGVNLNKMSPIAQSIFLLIKPVLDANARQYSNGTKGGAPKGNKNAQKNNPKTTQKQPKNNPKTTDAEIEKENSPHTPYKENIDEEEEKEVEEEEEEEDDEEEEEDGDNGGEFFEEKGNVHEGEGASEDFLHTGTWAHTDASDEKIHEIILQGIVEFYENNGARYIPDYRVETTAAVELAGKIRLSMEADEWVCDDNSLRTYWSAFLYHAYMAADQWQRDHFDIKTINSQFNSIYNKLKNGNSITSRKADAADLMATLKSHFAAGNA